MKQISGRRSKYVPVAYAINEVHDCCIVLHDMTTCTSPQVSKVERTNLQRPRRLSRPAPPRSILFTSLSLPLKLGECETPADAPDGSAHTERPVG